MRVLIAVLLGSSTAQAVEVPKTCPPGFILTRSQNRNELHYEARREDGKVDTDRPLVGRWRMVEKGPDVWEDWTWLERVMVYGIKWGKALDKNAKRREFRIKAAPGLALEIDLNAPCPKVSSLADGSVLILTRVFIETDARDRVPDQMKATLTGLDSAGKLVTKNITLKP